MGFFDDLGKKVTDAGQKAMQKTQEMSEIVRVNSLISQNENKINNAYVQIGKLFVSTYGNECEPEFAEMVATVAELEQQIAEYKKQIQDIKGIQRCEKCGAEVPRGVVFCSSCGAAMPKADEHEAVDDSVKCPGCGNMVKKDVKFCSSCGHAMTPPAEDSADTEAAAPSEPEKEAEERVCTKCGAKLTEGSAFCSECGTKV